MKAPTLVLGAEPRVAVTIARSLKRRGIPVDVCRLGNEPDPRSKAVRRSFVLPSDPETAGEGLLQAIEAQGYDYIVPTSDTALALIIQCHDELTARVRISCPPPDRLREVLDKEITLQVARSVEVPVPTTSVLHDAGDPAAAMSGFSGPVIVKPVDKRFQHGFKIRYFATPEAYIDAARQDSILCTGVMIQEFVPGEGVGVEVLMYDGRCIAAFQHRRIRELPWSGGVSVVAVSEQPDPQLLAMTLRLMQGLRWEGLAMAEYRQDLSTGKVALLEVNGRNYGSLSLSWLAGVDFPLYEWQLAHGETPSPPPGYQQGLRWRWTAGVLYRLKDLGTAGPPWLGRPGVLRESVGLLRDMLPPTRDALWSWRDPIPARRELSRAFAGIGRHLVRSTARLLLPKRAVRGFRYWRYMDPKVRRHLAPLRLRRTLGIARMTRRRLPNDVQSVLFICHGNIIRSAFSEAWLKQQMDASGAGIVIRSAGLRAIEGRPADPRAITAAGETGIDLTPHSASPLTQDLVDSSDLIVVMDYLNEANLLARFPEVRPRVRLIAECGRGSQAEEVEDPYEKDLDAVRESYRRLLPHLQVFAGRLRRE